jgi:PKD repeat protein
LDYAKQVAHDSHTNAGVMPINHNLMKKIGIKFASCLIIAVLFAFNGFPAGAQTVIYTDNFDVPNTTSFDSASQTGRHTGLLATNVVPQSGGIELQIANGLLLLPGQPGSKDARLRFDPSTNYTGSSRWDWSTGSAGAAILASGGMVVSFNWVLADSTANWISYCAGIAPNSDTALRVISSTTDSGILLENNGGYQTFELGAAGASGGAGTFTVLPTNLVSFAYYFTSWAPGSAVTVAVYVNGNLVVTQPFAWTQTGGVQNMELASWAAGTLVGNFSVTTLPPTPLAITADTTSLSPATVYAGSTLNLLAVFSGSAPITYQWKVNTGGGFVSIPNATNSTLTLADAQIANSGQYELSATNAAGGLTSDPLAVDILAAPANLSVNVQFTGSWLGSGNAPAQTGPAVIGNDGDFWNQITNPTGGTAPAGLATGTNLVMVDVGGIGTPVTLNYAGDYVFNGTAFGYSNPFVSQGSSVAPLMSGYMGSVSQGSAPDTNTITLKKLPPGSYDVYLYVNGRSDGQTRVDVLNANGQSAICGPNSGNYNLIAGVNYVHLTPTVTTNGQLTLSYYGTADAGQALLNGFQINGPVTLPSLSLSSDTTSDSPGSDYVGRHVTFQAAFAGYPAPVLQWEVDYGKGFLNIPNATNSSLTLAGVQVTNMGNYALFATNLAGALNSTPVTLTVLPLPVTGLAVDVQFVGTSLGSNFADPQSGPAAIGNNGDLWNPVSNPNPVAGDTNPISGSLQGLADASDIGTSISLAYTGATDFNSGNNTPFYSSGSPAANLMEACLGAAATNAATVTVQGLPPGTYDLYLYSSAGNSLQAEVSQFTANDSIATVGPNSANNVLTSGVNYILLTPVVGPNGVLHLSLVGSVTGQASLNGLQLYGPGVSPISPVASFSGAPTATFATAPVVFTDASTGSVTNWVWNFGDGTSVTNLSNASVTHVYAAVGTYTVSLTVIGADGANTLTQTDYIVASPVPTLGNPVLSGGSLTLSGANGTPGAQYRILSASSLTLPLASWIPVWTNTFAPDGTYSFTTSPLTNAASFFRLVSP